MKKSYRIGNWNQYNKSLINRGSITFWFSDDSISQWEAKKDPNFIGRPLVYSDAAILAALMIRYVFHLPLRALEGFIGSLIGLLNLSLPIPSYTQICRRAQKLQIPRMFVSSRKRITDIVFDASGLKVYGEGEWKVRTHGKSKRRTWKKIHIGMDPNTHDIILSELTESSSNDGKVFVDLLAETNGFIRRVYGDGIYDTEECYEAIRKKNAEPLIPIRKNAKYKDPDNPSLEKRNQQILEVACLGNDEIARGLWKKLKGYHKRSLVETAFYRWKTILESRLRSRKMASQIIESRVKCIILNKMNTLGLPKSYVK
jgi:hypothetical protein